MPTPHNKEESISPFLNWGVPLWLPQLPGFGGSDTMWSPSYKRWCSSCLISQDTCPLNPVTRWEAQVTCNGSGWEEQSLQYSTQTELLADSQYHLSPCGWAILGSEPPALDGVITAAPTWSRDEPSQLGSESESCSFISNSLRPHGLYSPWNSSGQNTGVGGLSLLQGIFPT